MSATKHTAGKIREMKDTGRISGTDSKTCDKVYLYFVLRRDKKSHPWRAVAVAQSGGAGCLSFAEQHFYAKGEVGANGENYHLYDPLFRIVGGRDWHSMEVRQHLKEVGNKQKM